MEISFEIFPTWSRKVRLLGELRQVAVGPNVLLLSLSLTLKELVESHLF